jgi:photosystem II stability/assembly factor-like uncharacterized protein
MRRFLTALTFATLLTAGCLSAPAHAAWTRLGPDGGSIVALAVDASTGVVYAATSSTLFRSADDGESWAPAADRDPWNALAGIRTVAAAGGVVYVGTSYDGIWRSTDGGATWRSITAGLGSASRPFVETLLVDPHRSERVWVTTSAGLFVSSDHGESWSVRSESLPTGPSTVDVGVDAATGQIYATTYNGLFTSTDDGASWSTTTCDRCTRLLVDPQRPGTLYATGRTVQRSRDGGSTWERIKAPRGAGNLLLLGVHAGRLFLGVRSYVNGNPRDRAFWSDDGGDHLVPAARQPAESSLSVLAGGSSALFLGSPGNAGPGGVFRSLDEGETWDAASAGLSTRWIESVAVDPLQPGVLYAKAADHLFKSLDDGESWQLGLPSPNVQMYGSGEVLADPIVAGRVWLAAFYLYRSDDGGAHWKTTPRLLSIDVLAPDPRTRGGMWAGGFNGLYASVHGTAWRPVKVSASERLGVLDVAVDPQDPRVVWAAGFGSTREGVGLGGRLYRSIDGGSTWQRRDAGLPIDASNGMVSSVALDPAQPDTAFAAAGPGLFRSRDGGATWQGLTLPESAGEFGRWEVVAAPTTPTTLYAHLDSPSSEAIYKSVDGGSTWQRVGGGAGAGDTLGSGIRALAVDPHDPQRLLAGTEARGVASRRDP